MSRDRSEDGVVRARLLAAVLLVVWSAAALAGLVTGGSGGGSGSVDDTAYDATAWNGVTTVAPSKNAVRDQIEAIVAGGVTDGDKGDLTVSGSGTVWTIDANAVGLTKLADMATASFLGRNTASTGDPEVLSIATAKTMLNLTGTNSGDQTITLTGDVTGSGTGSFAATIANDAVTYAKMQNISATQRVLARNTAGAGDPEEVTISQLLDWISSTRGTILYRGASGWAALAPDTAGKVLHTNGAGADPAWDVDDGAGGGAPTDIDYLVGTASASLSNEIVVGTTPGGELGGTWASPTLDDGVTVAQWIITGSSGAVGAVAGGHIGLSVQNNTGSSYIEILNSAGAGQGAFFGMFSNDFELINYQGGPTKFYTNTVASFQTLRFEITNAGLTKSYFGHQVAGSLTLDNGLLYTDAAMGALAVDTSELNNTKTISADSTLTFSATPATGAVFGLQLTNSDTAAHTITIPSTSKSDALGGAARTTFIIAPSQTVTIKWRHEGSSVYTMWGDPVRILDLASATPVAADSFEFYDLSAGVSAQAALSTLGNVAMINAAGFNGNLATTDDTIQEVAQKLDDLSTGGATAWDAIGDPSGNGTVAFGNTIQALTSTLDNGIVLELTDTDADAANDTTLLKLSHNDGADANVIYLLMQGDKDGTPTSDYSFTQSAFTSLLPIIPPAEAYDASGWNGDTGAPQKDAVRDEMENRATKATTITINGTTNEITSSAGAQDLSANRTWTISIPSTLDLSGKTVLLPNGSADSTLGTAGQVHLNTTDEQLSFHSAADGEVSGEVSIPIIQYYSISFDPKAVCDGAVDRLFLMSLRDQAPEGIIIDEWRVSFEADPTTEADLDLKSADAFIGVANAAVLDALDTTAGAASEDTDANINSGNAVANAKVLYLEFGTAYTEANHQIIFEMWYHYEED